jgi:hypothetical protein
MAAASPPGKEPPVPIFIGGLVGPLPFNISLLLAWFTKINHRLLSCVDQAAACQHFFLFVSLAYMSDIIVGDMPVIMKAL